MRDVKGLIFLVPEAEYKASKCTSDSVYQGAPPELWTASWSRHQKGHQSWYPRHKQYVNCLLGRLSLQAVTLLSSPCFEVPNLISSASLLHLLAASIGFSCLAQNPPTTSEMSLSASQMLLVFGQIPLYLRFPVSDATPWTCIRRVQSSL